MSVGCYPPAPEKPEDSAPVDEWVPLPNGYEKRHEDALLRCTFDSGRSMVQARVRKIDGDGVHFIGIPGGGWIRPSGRWFIHKDDVDRALVEEMAKEMYNGVNAPLYWDVDASPETKREFRAIATIALRVVRS